MDQRFEVQETEVSETGFKRVAEVLLDEGGLSNPFGQSNTQQQQVAVLVEIQKVNFLLIQVLVLVY